MGQHRFTTQEELSNVVQTIIPPGSVSGDPTSQPVMLSEELPDGTWLLTTEDSLDPAVDAVDPHHTPPSVLLQETNRQRDLALSTGFEFEGRRYQSRTQDREKLASLGAAAASAITEGGAKPGDLMWDQTDQPFEWIAEDNSRVEMDAQTTLRLSNTIASYQSRIIRSARSVKDQVNAGQITRIDQISPALLDNVPSSDVFPNPPVEAMLTSTAKR